MTTTRTLTHEESGLLITLTCLYWQTGGRLPDSTRLEALAVNGGSRAETLHAMLADHFPPDADGRPRCIWLDDARFRADALVSQRQAAGRASARKRLGTPSAPDMQGQQSHEGSADF
jgi:uncharacterized protein YdaU (DUF1376 family)